MFIQKAVVYVLNILADLDWPQFRGLAILALRGALKFFAILNVLVKILWYFGENMMNYLTASLKSSKIPNHSHPVPFIFVSYCLIVCFKHLWMFTNMEIKQQLSRAHLMSQWRPMCHGTVAHRPVRASILEQKCLRAYRSKSVKYLWLNQCFGNLFNICIEYLIIALIFLNVSQRMSTTISFSF